MELDWIQVCRHEAKAQHIQEESKAWLSLGLNNHKAFFQGSVIPWRASEWNGLEKLGCFPFRNSAWLRLKKFRNSRPCIQLKAWAQFRLDTLRLIPSFGIFSLLPAFHRLVFQILISMHFGFLIGAWQPTGLGYWSQLAAAYPTCKIIGI